jgi:hypothetical protein
MALLVWTALLPLACSPGVPPTGVGGSSGTGGTGGTSSALPPPTTPCAFETRPLRSTSNRNCPDGVYRGDVTINDAAGIAQLAGCQRLAGNLTVVVTSVLGLPIADLRGLESLRVIEGNVKFHGLGGFCFRTVCAPTGALGNISTAGLDHLSCVGGSLETVNEPQTQIRLPELVEVGRSLNVSVTSPGSIEPFAALRRVWGDVSVQDDRLFPVLEAVYGNLHVSGTTPDLSQLPKTYVGCAFPSPYTPCRDGILGCKFDASNQAAVDRLANCVTTLHGLPISGDAITNLAPLRKLRTVHGALTIQDTSVSDFSPLSELEQVTSLIAQTKVFLKMNFGSFRRLTELDELKVASFALDTFDFPALRKVRVIDISGLSLATLNGLRALEQVEQLRISMPDLQDLHGLEALRSAKEIELDAMPALTSLTGLSGLQSLDSLELRRCGLQSLQGVSALRTVGELGLYDLRELKSLQGLESVTSIGQLIFYYMPKLTSFAGLSSVQSIESFSLGECPVLTDLRSMRQLTHVGRISIANDSLSACEIDWLYRKSSTPNPDPPTGPCPP